MATNRIKHLGAIAALILMGLFAYWNSEIRIRRLLESEDFNDLMYGTYLAGESGNEDFVPMLLNNPQDNRTSTQIRFKGFSVYYGKMIALKKIYSVNPPVAITQEPDSMVIGFYENLYNDKLR